MAGENFFQWAGRNIGEYVSGHEGWIPGRDTAGKAATQFSGGDADWIPGVSVAGGDRNPTSGWIGPTAIAQRTTNKPQPHTGPTGETTQQQAAARIAAQQAAAQQEAQRKNQLRGQYTSAFNNERDAKAQALREYGDQYSDANNAVVNKFRTGVEGINKQAAQNELNLRQSMANIIKNIQTGVRSGNVLLAGMNASDSGAVDALARAYARVGNNQSAEANSQAATVSDQLATSQRDLNKKRDEGIATLDRNRATEVDRVRNDFGTKIDQLIVDASSNGISGIADRSMVDAVLNEALGRLTGLTQSRDSRLAGVRAWGQPQIAEEAARLQALGQTGNAFAVADPTVQYGGANSPISNGELPIYVKGREDALVANPFKKDTRLVTA